MEHAIRRFDPETQLDLLMGLWLRANTDAHDFLPADYWQGHYDQVAEMLPQSELWVYWLEDRLAGFIGLVDGHIEGLFVEADLRSHGVGVALLNHAATRYSRLWLEVYEKNERAYAFYLRQGFVETGRRVGTLTGETEVTMEYQS